MTTSMYHRGPDDDGLEVVPVNNGWLALGSRRLAIQDLSASGHQPMQDHDTGNWLVFNGEVYNFRVLRAQLQRQGVHFESSTDTEVLLKGYACWGLGVVSLLQGMFAFALWDARAERLILARDRLGVKPLYYQRHQNYLIFASEVQALASSGMIAKSLSIRGLVNFLALGAVHEPGTILRDVWAQPAGHYAVLANGNFSLNQYWSLEECFHAGEHAKVDGREMAERVRSSLVTAIGLRLSSDAPIGTFLSGGLDSSAVTALAAQQSSKPVRTVSVVFPEEAFPRSGIST